MKSVSARVLMTIAAANDLEVMVGDIGNAYLHADTEGKGLYLRMRQVWSSRADA